MEVTKEKIHTVQSEVLLEINEENGFDDTPHIKSKLF